MTQYERALRAFNDWMLNIRPESSEVDNRFSVHCGAVISALRAADKKEKAKIRVKEIMKS